MFARGRQNFPAVSEFFFFYVFTRQVIKSKMPNIRETRVCVAYAYRNSLTNEQEFVFFFHDFHKSKNPQFSQWNNERFDLKEKINDECKAEFRFYREDTHKHAKQLQLPDEIITYNGLCMYLKRYAYPCRYGD